MKQKLKFSAVMLFFLTVIVACVGLVLPGQLTTDVILTVYGIVLACILFAFLILPLVDWFMKE